MIEESLAYYEALHGRTRDYPVDGFRAGELAIVTYVKRPVTRVSELYARYPDGGEWGWVAFVQEKGCWAYWNETARAWVLSGTTHIEQLSELLKTRYKGGDILVWDEEAEAFVPSRAMEEMKDCCREVNETIVAHGKALEDLKKAADDLARRMQSLENRLEGAVFAVSKSGVTFGAAGGEERLTVQSEAKHQEAEWAIEGEMPEWCEVRREKNLLIIKTKRMATTGQRTFRLKLVQTGTKKEVFVTVAQEGFVEQYTFSMRITNAPGSIKEVQLSETTGASQIPIIIPAAGHTFTLNTVSEKTTVRGKEQLAISMRVKSGDASLAIWDNAQKRLTMKANPKYETQAVELEFTQAESGKKLYIGIGWTAKTDDGTFTAEPTSLAFTAQGGSKTVTVTSTSKGASAGWSVEKSSLPSWLSVSGEGTGLLTVTAQANG